MSIYEYDEEKHLAQVREEGREEGRKEGREEGKKEGGASMITNMLRKGKSPEEIADMTGEDLEEIQEIQKQLL